MKKFLKTVSLVLVMMMVLSMVSFAAADAINVTLPHYKTGENVGAIFFMPQVERFNAAYEGKYHITLEELTQDMYSDKIKQLGMTNNLPFLIEGGDTQWVQEVVIPNNMFVDLKSFAEEAGITDIMIDAMIKYNTTEDGQLFSLQLPVVRPMGMFYNGSMMDLGDKTVNEMNWDEFLACVGDNKIALMTGENAWTTQLVLSSLIAVEEGGIELLSSHTKEKIYDFSHPAFVNAITKLQKIMQNYGVSNMIGAVYADNANSFMSKMAAVIANGSWMVGNFSSENSADWSNGFDGADVRGAVLPGNVALVNTDGYGWWIPANISDDAKEVAKAFIAFMMTPAELESYMLAEGGVAPMLQTSEEYVTKASSNPLMYEYVNATDSNTILVPCFGDCVPSSIGATEFGNLLPLLVDGTYTPEQFCQELTLLAEETRLN